jgi:two-component system response regulator WspF
MRIAIVNDVALAIDALRRIVLSTKEHHLAWIARDGAEALDLCTRDTPDLILMDLFMPKLDGVEATRRIMARAPCAIVIVTADVKHHASKVFEAMGVGALDAVNTPVLECPGTRTGAAPLLAKIETMRRLVGTTRTNAPSAMPPHPRGQPAHHSPPLIGLGASAGGPTALATVLSRLPADFPAAVVIVQHMDAKFAPGLADWLGGRTPLRVRLACEGERPETGTALLAGQNCHLVLTSPTRLAYIEQPADCAYRPSVNLLFQSASRVWRGDVIGVVLSGMGRDGAEGLRALRASGHHTIAQDCPSSTAYGMPRAAAELHAAAEILALDKIGPRLRNIVTQKVQAHG